MGSGFHENNSKCFCVDSIIAQLAKILNFSVEIIVNDQILKIKDQFSGSNRYLLCFVFQGSKRTCNLKERFFVDTFYLEGELRAFNFSNRQLYRGVD